MARTVQLKCGINFSRKENITPFLLMLQYVCFLRRINMARGLTNNKIISTVEFITTLCKSLLSFHHYLAALLLCRGTFFAHFLLSFTHEALVLYLFNRIIHPVGTSCYSVCHSVVSKVRFRVLSVAISVTSVHCVPERH